MKHLKDIQNRVLLRRNTFLGQNNIETIESITTQYIEGFNFCLENLGSFRLVDSHFYYCIRAGFNTLEF